jgi:hypothetical protein
MTDETARPTRHAILIDTLIAVFDALESRTPSAHVRELSARARTYESALKEWAHREPTPAQYAAMLDCVTELHTKVMRPEAVEARTSLPPRSEARPKEADAPVSARPRRQSSG